MKQVAQYVSPGQILALVALAAVALLVDASALAAVPAIVLVGSNQVTEAMVVQYATNFIHVAQQSVSRLQRCVHVEQGVTGTSFRFNRIGKKTAQKRTTRHSDTPINDTPHSSRWADLEDWEDGDMVDSQDKIRLLTDPTNEYTKAGNAALERAKDLIILLAQLAAARTGASSSQALTAGQQIAAGGTGMTKPKLIQAKKLFRINECDEFAGEELYMAYTGEQLEDLLNQTEPTSADYNNVKALVDGQIKRWLGFEWVPTELVPKSGTTRQCRAWAKSGTGLAIGQDIVGRIGEDPGKGFNVRVYHKMTMGGVRIEEEKVVQVDCFE